MKRVAAPLGLALVLVTPPTRAGETGFLDRTVTVAGEAYRYQVFAPRAWTAERSWPVILFLHGAGERGDDGLLQTAIGLPAAIRRNADRFPAVVVMPQCRRGVWWPDPEMEALAIAALDAGLREFRGDPERVYLTGLSMGGYGTVALGSRHTGRFAALVSVAGGVCLPPGRALGRTSRCAIEAEDPYAAAAARIGRTPTWLFHGGADATVPVTESQKLAAALKAAGGDVRYTEYEGVAHDSWTRAYAEPELMPWLLAQRRAAASGNAVTRSLAEP